jgi:hypothetical protein
MQCLQQPAAFADRLIIDIGKPTKIVKYYKAGFLGKYVINPTSAKGFIFLGHRPRSHRLK